MKCPIHGDTLLRSNTKYGYRYDCPVLGCTVMAWGGETSTPANKETRELRKQAHALFDAVPLSKGQRYKWLQKIMNLKPQEAHIGMFTANNS